MVTDFDKWLRMVQNYFTLHKNWAWMDRRIQWHDFASHTFPKNDLISVCTICLLSISHVPSRPTPIWMLFAVCERFRSILQMPPILRPETKCVHLCGPSTGVPFPSTWLMHKPDTSFGQESQEIQELNYKKAYNMTTNTLFSFILD